MQRSPVLQSVFDTAHAVVADPKWVRINDGAPLDDLAAKAAAEPRPQLMGAAIIGGVEASQITTVIFELVAASVNYCYWYGRHDVRPCGCTSVGMYQHLTASFAECGGEYSLQTTRRFYSRLVKDRFPLIEERHKHLQQILYPLVARTNAIAEEIVKTASCDTCPSYMSDHLDNLLLRYPGFAGDVFLKRASLFFTLLHQRFGWFSDEIAHLPVPADYQVPKMLRHAGVLEYHPALQGLIDDGCPIQKNGRLEAEIRASTVIAGQMLAERSGRTPADVDYYLWTKRKTVTDPFHLTLTTDY
jgi:hypothetical protein